MKSTFNVGEMAETFEVTPNTVRNWSKRYADFLSPGANPPAGQARTYSTRDLNVLQFVHSFLNDGLTHDEITHEIALKPIPEDQPVSIVDEDETTGPPAPYEPSALDVLQFVDSRFDQLARNDAAIHHRLTQLERSRFNTMAVLTAFLAGVLVTVAGILIALLLWVNILAA